MERKLKILAIDDHSMILEGYYAIFKELQHLNSGPWFMKAHDCESGYKLIESNVQEPFDIVLIDYNIPEFLEEKLYSGLELARLVRKKMPACKVVMLTGFNDVDIIGRILDRVNPEGFVNKADCTIEEISEGFSNIIEGRKFFSKTISNYIKRREEGNVLDETDTMILQLLGRGIKNKNLEKHIPLSGSAIEKRKHKIKKLLKVTGNDEDLIREARLKGYI